MKCVLFLYLCFFGVFLFFSVLSYSDYDHDDCIETDKDDDTEIAIQGNWKNRSKMISSSEMPYFPLDSPVLIREGDLLVLKIEAWHDINMYTISTYIEIRNDNNELIFRQLITSSSGIYGSFVETKIIEGLKAGEYRIILTEAEHDHFRLSVFTDRYYYVFNSIKWMILVSLPMLSWLFIRKKEQRMLFP